jgi:uncharacterized protein involved in exopolysaccharide biosynthesis
VKFLVLQLLWRNKLLTATAMVTAIIVGLVVYRLVPAKYEASSLLFMSSGSAVERAQTDTQETPERLLAAAQIALTDDVLARAIEEVRISKFVRSASNDEDFIGTAEARFNDAPKSTLKRNIRERALNEVEAERNEALTAVKSALIVKPDVKASVLIVRFRHADPDIAAKFVNALDTALIRKQHELWGPGIAADFFEEQKKKFDAQLNSSFEALTAYSQKSGVFSVDEQRAEIMQRYDRLMSEYAATQSLISQKTGERQAVTEQLLKLKPVTQSSFVTGIVDTFGAKNTSPVLRSDVDARTERTPPLLMIKVYQETIVDLFRDDAELIGLDSKRSILESQISEVKGQMGQLLSEAGKFALLRSAVTIAQYNVETYGKRMAEEIANQDAAKFRMSTLEIVQPAIPPVKPISPSLPLTFAASLIFGGVLSAIGIAAAEKRAIKGWMQGHVFPSFATDGADPA